MVRSLALLKPNLCVYSVFIHVVFHEPRQAQPQGPRQVIDLLENIDLWGDFHVRV